MGIKTKPFPKEIKLDSPEQLMKQKRSMAVFKQSKAAMLALKEQLKKGIKIGGIKF